MAQKQAAAEPAAKLTMPDPAEFAKAAEKQIETIAETQKEFFDTMAKMSQRWLDRAAADMKFATDFSSKLIAARSVPDAFEAYRQWMTERTKTLAEDSQQFVADCQTLMQEATRSLPKGWPTASS